MDNVAFWSALDSLVSTSNLVIDRPRGTLHPRYLDFRYPLDYGYLEGTTSGDGGGIDIWLGTLVEKRVTGIVFTVDLLKRDAEVKILSGCTTEEMETILKVHQRSAWGGSQSAILVPRP